MRTVALGESVKEFAVSEVSRKSDEEEAGDGLEEARDDYEKRRQNFSAQSPRRERRGTRAKSAKPTIALFFRAAFVHLTMLQSTPAYTVLRPPLFSPPSVVVLLSVVAPLSVSLSIRIDIFLFFTPRASPFLSRFFQALPLERRAILSHPALFTPAIYPSADNKRRPPSPRSRNRRRSAQCAMHFCD